VESLVLIKDWLFKGHFGKKHKNLNPTDTMQSDKCMNKRLIAITLLLCFAALTITGVNTSKAEQNYIPGLIPGDNFWYTEYSHWTSSDANATLPLDLVAANETAYTEVRISDVNITTVTTFTAFYYTDNTPQAARGTANILTGSVTDGGFPAIIAANLTAGQIIHPSGSDGITINETITKDSRQTNRIYITRYNATTGLTATDDRYFDQITGMLVEEIESQSDGGAISGITETQSITTIIASSPWDPHTITPATPEFPPILAIPIFIGAITLMLIAMKKKHLLSGQPSIKA
jgi:hypothetical protein